MAPYKISLRTSQLRARRKKSPWHLVLLVPAFALMGAISVGVVWLLEQLQSARCPDGTFFLGSGQVAMVFQTIPIFIGSIGISLLAANWIAHSIPPVRDFFDRDPRLHGERGYAASQRGLLKVSAVTLALALAIGVGASLSQYCLLDDQVLYQRWPWTGLRSYSWHDLEGIETSCFRSRSSWNGHFFLILRDGSRFDLLAWPRAFVRAYPELARALEDGDFSFDSRGVMPGCTVPYLALLTRRP
jgi:hypothetical protein